MNRRLVFGGIGAAIILIIAVIVFGGSGGVNTAQVGDAYFAASVIEERSDSLFDQGQDAFEVMGRAESFVTTTPEIYAVVELSNIEVGSEFEYRWIDLDANRPIFTESRAPTTQFYPFRRAISKLSRNTQTWDAGNYQFQLWQSGQLVIARNFTVKTPAQSRLDRLRDLFPRIELAREVGLDGRVIGRPSTVFTQSDTVVYASVDYVSVPDGTVFSGRWIDATTGKSFKSYTRRVAGSGTFSFSLDATKDLEVLATRFPRGRYSLIVSVDNEQLEEITFEIQ